MTALLLVLFVIIGLTLAGVGFNLLRTILLNLSPSESKIQGDIRKMRAEIEPYVEDLVPIDSYELELFSLNQLHQSLNKSITTTAKGVFTSVYQEPLVAYSYKKYVGTNNALLFARTATREIVYRITKKGTKVAINQGFYGTIKDRKLYGEDDKQVLAKVNRRSTDLLLPVTVGDKEIALLDPKNIGKLPHPRAFQYVDTSVNEWEEQAFLTLAILELVKEYVE